MSSPIDVLKIPGWAAAPPPPARWFTLASHGDLNALEALHLAAKRADQPQWHELADRFALHTLEHASNPLDALHALSILALNPTPWTHILALLNVLAATTTTSPTLEHTRTLVERFGTQDLVATPVSWWRHVARGQLLALHTLPHWVLRGPIAQQLTTICGIASSFTPTSLTVDPEGLSDQHAFQNALVQWLTQPQWPRLKHLTLRRCRLWDTGLQSLGQSTVMGQLQTFHLAHQRISASGLQALLNHRQLGSLTSLTLRHCLLQADGIAALVQTRPFQYPSALRTLDLSHNATLGARGVETLSQRQEQGIEQLTQLSLEHCRLITEGAIALFNNRRFAQLETLNLSHNALATGAVLAMTRQRIITPSKLCLAHNQLTHPALTSLGHWSGAEKIHHLDLCGNRLGPQSLPTLADSRHLNAVHTLKLDHNPILDHGIQALSGRPHLKNLCHISLNACGLQGSSLESLTNFAIGRPLQNLHLANPSSPTPHVAPPHPNELHANACTTLAQANTLTRQLRVLDLSGNPIGDDGLIALAFTSWPCLEVLGLRNCQLEDTGLLHLLTSHHVPRLRVLDLRDNPGLLGRTVIKALVTASLLSLRRVLLDPDTLHPEERHQLATSQALSAALRYTFRDWDHHVTAAYRT